VPILWAQQPNPWRTFKLSTAIWLFAIPWSAITSAGLIADLTGPFGSWLSGLFLVPFVGIGIAMMLIPFFVAIAARNSVAAISKDSIFELTVLAGVRTRSYALADVTTVSCKERADGKGDIKIKFRADAAHAETFELVGIPDVQNVMLLLDGLRRTPQAA
jgi:hypothetical protein